MKAEKDYLAGMTYAKLAGKYNVSESTIKTWRKKFGWIRQKGEKVSELDTKQGNFRAKNTQKTTNKKVQSKRAINKLKKEALLTYETTTLEDYEAMREDLLNQLKNNGVTGLFYNDLVDVYMKMYSIKNKLILDIEERGVAVEWSNGKQISVKRNDSLDGLHKTVAQMLNILTKLGLDIPENKTVSQVICHKEYLLISFIEGGCIRYNLEDNASTELPQLPAKASIFTIYIGSQNILWVGTDGQGVLEVYEHSSPFHTVKTDYPVRCFCEEDNGNILVGTKGEGILLLDKQERQVEPYLSTGNGLISNSVYTIRKNMSGDIFIGTEGTGINYIPLNSSQVKKLSIPAEYPTFKAVYSILFTHNDSLLWLGTSGYGLIKLTLQREG